MLEPPALNFFKYHGTGNDFVIVDAAGWSVDVAALAPAICDRHRGIGADGIIAIDTRTDDLDATMTIFNADGSRPEMCGNGIRCVVRHLVEVGGFDAELRIATDAGERRCVAHPSADRWEVDVDMGKPGESSAIEYEWGDRTWVLHPVDMGNPHAVTFEAATIDEVDGLGGRLNEPGAPFEKGVNVEFVTARGDSRLEVVVYERGVGRTQACGTGACAAAVAAWNSARTSTSRLVVALPGGELVIRRDGDHVWMRGEVEFVFGGALRPDWLKARTT